MSTASLPSYYIAPTLGRTPSYTEEPQEYEQRIALADRFRPRPSGTFVKQSKHGDARLKLNAQDDNAVLPVYGAGGVIDGVIDIAKTDGVTSVEVKVEGRLRLKEVAEGGTTTAKLCLDTALLWIKDPHSTVCPKSLPFRLTLPSTFEFDGKSYTLPPTYEVKLSGLPGFNASTDYSVSAIINKPNAVPSVVPLVTSSWFGINIGSISLSTPFIYYPRTRPALPIPRPLRVTRDGFELSPEWRSYDSTIRARSSNLQDINTFLYLPASRIFCSSQPIPFHLTFQSSALSLASFMPFGPSGNPNSKKPSRIQLMRQVTVDVRNELVLGTKTDIWKVDCIGEATFKHAGDGPTWVAYTGEILVDPSIKVTGFRAGGLTIKDCILFSMMPPDPKKSPFSEIRQVIPIRLTTDPWTADGTGIGGLAASDSQYSIPSSPENSTE